MPWGHCVAVGADGDRAVFGLGSVARVVDPSTPESPETLGELLLPAALAGVAFVGSHAVLSDRSHILHIVDLHDPRGPIEVAAIELPAAPHRMAVAGDVLLAVLGWEGLGLVDLSDPTSPALLDQISIGDGVNDVVVQGGRAFVSSITYGPSAEVNGLTILDLGDPSSPVEVGTLSIDDSPSTIQISGSHVYLTLWETGLAVVDVSDVTEPRLVTQIQRWMRATGMVVHGSDLCISEGNQGLIVFDISDPETPTGKTTVGLDGWSSAVAISGSHALVASGQAGLHIIDLEHAAGPVEVASIEAYPWVREVAIVGDRLHVRSDELLRLYEVTHTGALDEIGCFDLSDLNPMLMTATEDRVLFVAALAGSWSGPALSIVDTSSPSHPVLLGRSDPVTGYVDSMALLGDHVFVAGSYLTGDETWIARLWVIDISDPTSPVEAALLESDGWFRDIEISGDLLYAGYGSIDDEGLMIFDISQRARPAVVDLFPTDGWSPRDIEIENGTLYATNHHDLYVLSLDDPHQPLEVGFLGRSSSAGLFQLRVDRNRVLLYNTFGIQIIDVRDRTRPERIGQLDLPAIDESYDVQNGVVYVAAADSGVQVFGPCRSTATRSAAGRTHP
jgi:hypothetical protein